MHNKFTLEIAYLYILINTTLKNKSENSFKKLLDFFSLNSIFDIKTYFNIRAFLFNSYDLNYLKSILSSKTVTKNEKIIQLKKFQEYLSIFINNKLSTYDISIVHNKINKIITILEQYNTDDLANFLLSVCQYLNSETDNNTLIIFSVIEEYLDLFIDADKIIFNNELINNQFKHYFDLLHIYPENICFINKKNNIKIMQNFFPFEIICKIFKLLKNKTLKNPNKKYFLIEYDKKLVSKKQPELLLHEIGHILNLKVYNYQEYIVNQLYNQDKSVNTTIISYWMNEIIADIIGKNLCKTDNFMNVFSNITENVESMFYPPISFRKAILEGSSYDFSSFKNADIKKAALLIFNNINSIKSILTI